MEGPQCRLSILRNGNVPCHYFIGFPVDFKSVQCRLSILRNGNVLCHYISNFPVDFKILTKGHVALSNLRVKGHIRGDRGGEGRRRGEGREVLSDISLSNRPAV